MSPNPTQLAVRASINAKHAVIDRSSWGIRQPVSSRLESDWNYQAIALHHSGNWGKKDPKDIEKIHMVDNGWDDVGYHYLVHPSGSIYEGRKIYHEGAHVLGANPGKIGVLLLGDYDEQLWDWDDELSASHVNVVNGLIATLIGHFPSIRQLGGHKEFLKGQDYTCPGNLILQQLAPMRARHGLSAP